MVRNWESLRGLTHCFSQARRPGVQGDSSCKIPNGQDRVMNRTQCCLCKCPISKVAGRKPITAKKDSYKQSGKKFGGL